MYTVMDYAEIPRLDRQLITIVIILEEKRLGSVVADSCEQQNLANSEQHMDLNGRFRDTSSG